LIGLLLDNLPDVAVFCWVADAGSLSAASRARGVPVARLSRRLAALETALGMRLIDRTSRQFRLTDDGRLLREEIGSSLANLEHAVAHALDRNRGPSGTLRLSASPDFGAPFLSPLIAAFGRDHPQITFEIDLSPRRVDLHAERFDAAIRVGPLGDSDLTARRFATVPAYLYASRAYLDRHGAPAHPTDLARHRCLPLPHMNGVAHLHRGDEIVEAAMTGPAKVNNLVMLRRLCGEGFGIAVLNAVVAGDGDDRWPIERVLPEWRLEPAVFYFLTSSRLLPARTRAFFDFARERLKAQGY
jgi:DNA-binding transcriptional LysR family regulator